MQIEFFYFADCPSHEQALERLQSVLSEVGISVAITINEVTSEDEAQALRFLGSPTIRINGADMEASAANRHDYGLSCRAYRRPDGRISPLPPREMILAALQRVRS